MKQVAIFWILLWTTACISFAQNNFIQFEKTEHDFGNRKEEEENLDYSFKFKNVSGGPIKLTYVKASCGCTTPSYTQEIIETNQEGFVKASYGARGRPGQFNKSITVRTAKVDPKTRTVVDSNNTDTKVLYIKGDVAARAKGVNDWYPMEDGNLRFSTNHLAFGNIKTTEVQTKDFVVFNQGKKVINISAFKNDYPHIKVTFPAGGVKLNPRDSVRLGVTYDATKVNDWDWTHVQLSLVSDDDSTSNTWYKNTPGDKKIYVSATVVEDFSKLDPAMAPKIEFDKEVHDFGEIKQGDKVSTTFIFKNSGKSDLVIRKSKASCGCTASQPEKTTLKPGETSKIDVTFDSSGKEGQQSKTITVVCNDPQKSTTRLEIKSNIKKSEDDKKNDHKHDHSDPNHKH